MSPDVGPPEPDAGRSRICEFVPLKRDRAQAWYASASIPILPPPDENDNQSLGQLTKDLPLFRVV